MEPLGLAAFHHVVGQADILVDGFLPGVAERMGVGPEDCAAQKGFHQVLGLDFELAGQHDQESWPSLCDVLQKVFIAHPQSHWERVFGGKNARVTPVLGLRDASTFGDTGDAGRTRWRAPTRSCTTIFGQSHQSAVATA
jgi:crotonobetainyl-CoA:carnitine CoA-transferase CaiB-like acyl-CoA transferase